MRLMLLKAASSPAELFEAHTLNPVAVVMGVQSKACPPRPRCWLLHGTGGEKAATSPLLPQHRDTLLNAEKLYMTFQQDKTTSKARFYLKSSCAKTLVSPTDTVWSLRDLHIRVFPLFKRCLGFERKPIYFILICDQRDTIPQVKRTLCWRVLPCSFTLCPTQAYSFQTTPQCNPAGPTSQLSHSNYFSSSTETCLTALQVPCFFTAPVSPNLTSLIMPIISFPDWKQNTCFLLATTSNFRLVLSHTFNLALTLGKNCLWIPREMHQNVWTRDRDIEEEEKVPPLVLGSQLYRRLFVTQLLVSKNGVD